MQATAMHILQIVLVQFIKLSPPWFLRDGPVAEGRIHFDNPPISGNPPSQASQQVNRPAKSSKPWPFIFWQIVFVKLVNLSPSGFLRDGPLTEGRIHLDNPSISEYPHPPGRSIHGFTTAQAPRKPGWQQPFRLAQGSMDSPQPEQSGKPDRNNSNQH